VLERMASREGGGLRGTGREGKEKSIREREREIEKLLE